MVAVIRTKYTPAGARKPDALFPSQASELIPSAIGRSETIVFTGVRRSELLNLQLDDVDLAGRQVRVVNGKGSKSRAVPMMDELVAAVRDWLEFRPECDHDRVFTSQLGNPLYSTSLQRMWLRTLERSGIRRKGVSMHTLRHSFATLLFRAGVDVWSLQRLLGHASLETTAQYLHLQTDDLRAAVDRQPLG